MHLFYSWSRQNDALKFHSNIVKRKQLIKRSNAGLLTTLSIRPNSIPRFHSSAQLSTRLAKSTRLKSNLLKSTHSTAFFDTFKWMRSYAFSCSCGVAKYRKWKKTNPANPWNEKMQWKNIKNDESFVKIEWLTDALCCQYLYGSKTILKILFSHWRIKNKIGQFRGFPLVGRFRRVCLCGENKFSLFLWLEQSFSRYVL